MNRSSPRFSEAQISHRKGTKLIADWIEKSLARWEPRIRVQSVDVDPDPKDEQAVVATIVYSLVATQASERVGLSVPRGAAPIGARYDADAFGRMSEAIARFLGTGRFLAGQTVLVDGVISTGATKAMLKKK